jgi:hypothetical protein
MRDRCDVLLGKGRSGWDGLKHFGYPTGHGHSVGVHMGIYPLARRLAYLPG